MMLPNYNDFLVAQERHKDRLHEAERRLLIRDARLLQAGNRRVQRKVAGWIGDQMVNWGYKLQDYGTPAMACCPQVPACR
jgi:hypothetical protein